MGVAPLLHIAQGDIHSTDKDGIAVDDTDLSVVTVVNLSSQCGEVNRHEGLDMDASLADSAEETVVNFPASYIIVDE